MNTTRRRISWRAIIITVLVLLVIWTIVSLILGLTTSSTPTGVVTYSP